MLAFVLGLTVLLHDVSTSGCLAIAVVTGAHIIFTLALGLVSAVALLLGASTSMFVVFVLVWRVPPCSCASDAGTGARSVGGAVHRGVSRQYVT